MASKSVNEQLFALKMTVIMAKESKITTTLDPKTHTETLFWFQKMYESVYSSILIIVRY
jgi:phage antirepressor YoqD-like protein